MCEDAGLVLDHQADVKAGDEVVDFVNRWCDFIVGFQVHVFENGGGITEGNIDDIGYDGACGWHHSCASSDEDDLTDGVAEDADCVE